MNAGPIAEIEDSGWADFASNASTSATAPLAALSALSIATSLADILMLGSSKRRHPFKESKFENDQQYAEHRHDPKDCRRGEDGADHHV
jgi:hypothetical protein